MKRLVALLSLAALLGGCKNPPGAAGYAPSSQVRAGEDIAIKNMRTSTPNDAVAGSNDLYYIVDFTFTNHLGVSLVPKINHFVIEDGEKRRYLGADSGNIALIGISNASDLLKEGDSHEYTVGFRAPATLQGRLFYDASF